MAKTKNKMTWINRHKVGIILVCRKCSNGEFYLNQDDGEIVSFECVECGTPQRTTVKDLFNQIELDN